MIGFKSNRILTIQENSLPPLTRWLILTDNKLRKLPESMGTLKNLQKCMLAGNQLEALPSSMSQCIKLELLRISANQLTHLPNWLIELPSLRWLAFSGNTMHGKVKKEISSQVHSVSNKLPTLSLSELELKEVLGQGASGTIYRAHWLTQTPSNCPEKIAVKIFKGSVTSDGYPIDELHASLETYQTPNLVRICAELIGDDTHGLVMELIPDGYQNLGMPPSLESCTRDTFPQGFQLNEMQIKKIALQIVQSLADLHSKGINHGDLYAHNVLFNHNGDALLSDFGAASLYKSGSTRLPEEQIAALQTLELRAFGCLIEDLLSVCESSSNTLRGIEEIKTRCIAATREHELNFDSLKNELEELVNKQLS